MLNNIIQKKCKINIYLNQLKIKKEMKNYLLKINILFWIYKEKNWIKKYQKIFNSCLMRI